MIRLLRKMLEAMSSLGARHVKELEPSLYDPWTSRVKKNRGKLDSFGGLEDGCNVYNDLSFPC